MNNTSMSAIDNDSLSICFSDVDSLYSIEGEQFYSNEVSEDGVGLRDSTMTRSSDGSDPKCVGGDSLPLGPSDDDDHSIIPLSYYLQGVAAPESSIVNEDDRVSHLTPMSEISVFSCVSVSEKQHVYVPHHECRDSHAQTCCLLYPLTKTNSSRVIVNAILDRQEKKRAIAGQIGVTSKSRRRCTM